MSVAQTQIKQNQAGIKTIVVKEMNKKASGDVEDTIKDIEAKKLKFAQNFKDFNRMIGNPYSKVKKKYQDVADFQIQYDRAINQYHKVVYLKSRKLGATETVNRSFARNVGARYEGHDIIIVAGNKLEIAKEIIKRFDELFHDKRQPDGEEYAFKDQYNNKWKYEELVRRSALEGNHPIMEFRNDTRCFGFAASKSGQNQSFRGPDDIIAAFISEAAHTGMNEDQPIMDGLLPNLSQRDDADFVLESTGNGKRGFFYNYWMDIMKRIVKLFELPPAYISNQDKYQELVDLAWTNADRISEKLPWFPMMTDWTVGVREGILSKKFLAQMKDDPNIDFEQEYCCKFTSAKTAAFESLSDENYLAEDEKSIDLSSII